MTWVSAVADRAACGMMALEGSTLFSEENAKAVRKHFPAVLESLVKKDDEPEPAEPDSPRDEAASGS